MLRQWNNIFDLQHILQQQIWKNEYTYIQVEYLNTTFQIHAQKVCMFHTMYILDKLQVPKESSQLCLYLQQLQQPPPFQKIKQLLFFAKVLQSNDKL